MRFEGKLSRRCQIQPIMTLCDHTLIILCKTTLMNAHAMLLPKFLKQRPKVRVTFNKSLFVQLTLFFFCLFCVRSVSQNLQRGTEE